MADEFDQQDPRGVTVRSIYGYAMNIFTLLHFEVKTKLALPALDSIEY